MGEFNFALESRFILSHEIFCRCTLVLLNSYTLNLTINNNSVQFVMHVYEFCVRLIRVQCRNIKCLDCEGHARMNI